MTEIHGNRTKLRCIGCGARWRFEEFPGIEAFVETPSAAPACPQCGDIVKGDTVMFGEPIPRSGAAVVLRAKPSAPTACSSPALRRR